MRGKYLHYHYKVCTLQWFANNRRHKTFKNCGDSDKSVFLITEGVGWRKGAELEKLPLGFTLTGAGAHLQSNFVYIS